MSLGLGMKKESRDIVASAGHLWPIKQFISPFLNKRRVSLAGRHISRIKDGAVLFSIKWYIIIIVII